ncbi:hypothetical protein A3D01_04860 [Candidatus Woesebacteria bacterium RIFCSPHIGHO2_02_FULL_39_13]|uniref:Glycosyltransferase 2-like domain-containing protein n=1 Tax=Candidatus Woesebacteria bacterium RIFCSPHIGHO2_02_FULL_39_13 TaxID=1802505 RepID=A0A1F7Z010_9BACT|nr:MAG: hypothetical protein A2692_00180 [Candidatus Woesebacteria bacterium RIFCSPHIGHO2_01_FULL_39_95]OGM32877.1 MAG: hypothetical protein A3D01_04860 [Candidatus Woesebacteria bacterium RIFCSPHIGHO2_02_FULL_39_13]
MTIQPKLTQSVWKKFYKLNNYYHQDTEALVKRMIPLDASVLEFGCKGGELLRSLPNKVKVGVATHQDLYKLAQKRLGSKKVVLPEYFFNKMNRSKFGYIVLSHTLSEVNDAQELINKIKNVTHEDSRVVVVLFNFLWKPVLDLAEKLGLRLPQTKEPNWWTENDIDNLFYLEGYEKIKSGKRFIFPYNLGVVSHFINKYLTPLPLLNYLTLTNYAVYKPISDHRELSVSIVIPARNESGNMKSIFKKIPLISPEMEIIFVEGHSTDDTYDVIKNEIKKYKGPIKTRLLKQKGKGKGDAVRLGFSKASNDLLMILDADLTVDPQELVKFYNAAVNGKGDLIMGSRLIYPMERQAMRLLNYFGNKFFSVAFTFLLGQTIKDTLCGTKVILKKNYEKIAENRKVFGNFDPFGDYDLIFGASNINLKITEVPIRYKERTYGKTNISRFRHGLLLLRMVYFAAKNLKFV